MTDYSQLPAYAGDTPRDAMFHYATDLFRRFCPHYGDVPNPQCEHCPFPARMSHNAKCCGWTVGQWQEEAIAVLQDLLGCYDARTTPAHADSPGWMNETPVRVTLTHEDMMPSWCRIKEETIKD